MVTENEILNDLKNNIKQIFPDLDIASISPSDSLKDLGANSLDRADILVDTMATFKLKLPMVAFKDANNINDIVQILKGASL